MQIDLHAIDPELINYFKEIQFTENEFRGWKTTRLMQISRLRNLRKLNSDLKINSN